MNNAECIESYSTVHSAKEQRDDRKLCDKISKMFAAIGHQQSFAAWSPNVLGCSCVVGYNRYVKSPQLNRQIDDIRVARPHRSAKFVAAAAAVL